MPDEKGRLGQQQALGRPGLFRRVRDEEPVRVERAAPERLEAARAAIEARPSLYGRITAAAAIASEKKRGRPKAEGERPWEAEGVSRRTWFRRKAKESGK